MSPELVPRDGVNVCMGAAIRLPTSWLLFHRVGAQQKGLSHDPCIRQSRVSS
jgi:hypothetical protein